MATNSKTSPSIHLRLLVATLIILPLFLGMTAWVLDRAFANYQFQAQRESMRLQQLLLAKVADWDGSGWVFDGLDEPRLNLLNSGLYAFVISPQGTVLWESPSAGLVGDLQNPAALVSEMAQGLGFYRAGIGENRFAECALGNGYYCHSTRVAWGSSGPESIFLIVETQAGIIAARNAYRSYLLWLLLAATLLLLLAQSLIFRWGLAPLRKIATGIKQLEQGKKDQLGGPYPKELVPLTDNINVLLVSEKNRRERVRNTMDRLTHVLKTPLMLIRNSSDGDREFRNTVQEQVTRMLGIVEGELAKARLDGRAADILGKPVPVQPVLQRIVDAYRRLPRPSVDVAGQSELNQGELDIDTGGISAGAVFHGDERDLQDLFGSILENSLKYCRHRITVTAQMQVESSQDWLVLTVGDDGDGIAAGYEQEILQRGARADTANAGQGLGLSIVVAIISAYGGSLHTDHSDLGGALFIIRLPGAAHISG
jgi:two-component system sensor histidine kinase PhoQ